MNKVILMGRLTKDPEIKYAQGSSSTAIARYTLAVERKFKCQGDEQSADFISCVSFGKTAEFVEKYLKQGTKVTACGRIQTGSYTNKSGQKIYTTDVLLEEIEFAESKNTSSNNINVNSMSSSQLSQAIGDGFINIPDGIDEELPFH